MTENSVALIALLLFLVLILVKPLGLYMAQVMEGGPATGRPIWALRIGVPVERLIYRLSGIDSSAEMGWKRYMIALLLFNSLGVLVLYALQRVQLWLPLNPQQFANVTPDSSFNTAVSFATNTNWQGYSGESTMSYLTQMLGLAVQNFLSAATGIVVVIALIRGFIRHTAHQALEALVAAHAHGRWLGILGEPRVNVLELNLALDAMKPTGAAKAPDAAKTPLTGA